MLRKRFNPPVKEGKRRSKYAKHRALPDDNDAASLTDEPGNGFLFALKFFAVICVLAVLVRLSRTVTGLRLGPAGLLRLSRRLLKR